MSEIHALHMQTALAAARKALQQKEFPVGCTLVHRDSVLADGCRRGTRRSVPSELAHAEMIALNELERRHPDIPRHEISLYCTLEPCLMCFGAILLSGIGTLVYAYEDAMGGAAACSRASFKPLYARNRIKIVAGVGRTESLALFKTFFRNPDNNYWRGSLLEHYTLEQK